MKIRIPIFCLLLLAALSLSAQRLTLKNYCQWRTDRVAEFILVTMKFQEWDTAQTRDSYFTLEKYENNTPLHFLIFSLPTENTETRYGFRCIAKWQ